MPLYINIKPDFEFEDQRGRLAQLVHEGFQQINVLESRQGVLRGGHYHRISHEAFYVVSGTVDVTLKKGELVEMAQFSPGQFFMIEPYVIHSMSFLEDCILVAMYDIPVEKEDGTKDIYPEGV